MEDAFAILEELVAALFPAELLLNNRLQMRVFPFN